MSGGGQHGRGDTIQRGQGDKKPMETSRGSVPCSGARWETLTSSQRQSGSESFITIDPPTLENAAALATERMRDSTAKQYLCQVSGALALFSAHLAGM